MLGSGPKQVANVTASDQEITAYYNQNKATYAPSDTRSLSQVVVQDQATANAHCPARKGGRGTCRRRPSLPAPMPR